MPPKVFEIGLCVLYAALNATGAGVIKSALGTRSLHTFWDFFYFVLNFKTILGFGLIFLSSLVVFKALSISKFTYILPVSTGINFLLVFSMGVLIFKEPQTVYSYLGAVLVVSGILMLSVK